MQTLSCMFDKSEKNSSCLKLQNWNNKPHKISLNKDYLRKTQYSNTTITINNDKKISLKSNTSSVVNKTKINCKIAKMNVQYQSIRCQIPYKSNKNFFQHFFCIDFIPKQLGCKCLIKCEWIDKFLSQLVQENSVKTIFHRKKISEFNINKVNPTLIQIQRDVKRTQPFSYTFQQQLYLNRLKQTLIAYFKRDPQVGYVQGMNMVASVVVYHSRNLYECVKIFRFIMIQCNLRQIYKGELSQGKRQALSIVTLLKTKCYNLFCFFTFHQVELEPFIIGWIFSLLNTIVPLEFAHLVIDLFVEKRWIGIYSLILTIFTYLKDKILSLSDNVQIMEFLSNKNMLVVIVDWEEIILSSYNFPLKQEQLQQISLIF